MVLLLVFTQLTRDLFVIAKFLWFLIVFVCHINKDYLLRLLTYLLTYLYLLILNTVPSETG